MKIYKHRPFIEGESREQRRVRLNRVRRLDHNGGIRKKRVPLAPITKAYILANVILNPFTRCWIWMLGKDNEGYGSARDCGRLTKVHRKAYELWFEPIPDSLYGCHICDTPSCCNPWHIFPGTNQENQIDAFKKGRHSNKSVRGRVQRLWLFEEVVKL